MTQPDVVIEADRISEVKTRRGSMVSGVRLSAKEKGAIVSIPNHVDNPERLSPPALAGQLATSNSVPHVPRAFTARRFTRLLRRVPVKSVCVAPAGSAYGAGENRSPLTIGEIL